MKSAITFIHPGEVACRRLSNDHGGSGPINFRRLIHSGDTVGPFNFLDFTIIPPGSSIGYHRHDGSSEIYLIASGNPLVTVNDDEHRLQPGGIGIVPAGGMHGLINDTGEDVVIFVVEFPVAPASAAAPVDRDSGNDAAPGVRPAPAIVDKVSIDSASAASRRICTGVAPLARSTALGGCAVPTCHRQPQTRSTGVFYDEEPRSWRLWLRALREIAYPVVHTTKSAFDQSNPAVEEFVGERPLLIAVDKVVHEIYGNEIRSYVNDHSLNVAQYVTVSGTESKKDLGQVGQVLEGAFESQLPRDGVLMAIGGGVTLDLTGLAASLFKRGIDYLRIPTTLIGMVDVGVGIKQGVNHYGKKNSIGTFFPPIGAVNDPRFLRTLDSRHIACGLAEIIKMGLVRDERLFELIELHCSQLMDTRFQDPPNVVREVMYLAEVTMMRELQVNLFEDDLRRVVDFGHSMSQKLEAASNYTLPHGEAVALDMALSTHIAAQRGLCGDDVVQRLVDVYRQIDLPLFQSYCVVRDLMRGLEETRNHRAGNLNLVVPTGVGSAEFIQDVTEVEIARAVAALAEGNY